MKNGPVLSVFSYGFDAGYSWIVGVMEVLCLVGRNRDCCDWCRNYCLFNLLPVRRIFGFDFLQAQSYLALVF